MNCQRRISNLMKYVLHIEDGNVCNDKYEKSY